MTDWKKTYSVWLHTSLIVAGIITAVVEYLQGLDPTTPAVVAVVGVVTVILRSIPQTPTPPSSGLNALFLLGLMLPLGCVNGAREACYAESRARFVVDQEECEDEACIDDLLERRQREQEACP